MRRSGVANRDDDLAPSRRVPISNSELVVSNHTEHAVIGPRKREEYSTERHGMPEKSMKCGRKRWGGEWLRRWMHVIELLCGSRLIGCIPIAI